MYRIKTQGHFKFEPLVINYVSLQKVSTVELNNN